MNLFPLYRHRLQQAAVALTGLMALSILLATGSIVMLRANPAGAAGKPVAPDSIALTGRLGRYEYRLEDARTALITATGAGTVYLVGKEETTLAGADVQFRLPDLGITGTMSPEGPGQYDYTPHLH